MGLLSIPLSSAPHTTGSGTTAPLAAAALVAYQVDLVVVGGCALMIAGVTDRCSDLDIVPEPSTENLHRLCDALERLGAPRPTTWSLDHQPLRSVTSPYGRIDLMTDTARREFDHLATHATAYPVEGVPVPIAALADVLRLRDQFTESASE